MNDERVSFKTPPPFFLLLHADHLCAIDEAARVHAVETVEFIRWERDREGLSPMENPMLPTECGLSAGIDWRPAEDGRGYPLGWPCRVSALRNGTTRCPRCHDLTGRKRPHKDWSAP